LKTKNSYRDLLIFSCLVTLGVLGVYVIFPSWIVGFTWIILAYFIGITFLTNLLMNRGTKGDAYDFYNYTMSSVAVRLLLSAGILFGYYYNFSENQYLFTFTFFILYFLFTGFEIRIQLSKLRQKQGSTNTHEKI